LKARYGFTPVEINLLQLMIYYRIERKHTKKWEGEKMEYQMIYYRIERSRASRMGLTTTLLTMIYYRIES